MAVRVDGSKCAYIKGDCACHGSSQNVESTCCCGEHTRSECDGSCDCGCQCDDDAKGCCESECSCLGVGDVSKGCCSGSDCLGCAEICPEDAIGRMNHHIVRMLLN